MIAALETPRAGEWKHCASTGRDTPVGLCDGPCCSLVESAWVFFERLSSGQTVARAIVCDDCTEEVVA